MKTREQEKESLIDDVRNKKITPVVLGGKMHQLYSQTNLERRNQKKHFEEKVNFVATEYYLQEKKSTEYIKKSCPQMKEYVDPI